MSPTADTVTDLDAAAAAFERDGFVALPRFLPADDVRALRPLFERLFAERAGHDEGAHLDMVGVDDDRPVQPQLLNPVDRVPALRTTAYRRAAEVLARRLLGPGARWSFEHAILKPAGAGVATPWHQDEAYREDPMLAYRQVSLWLPLQAVEVRDGCMGYLAGSHAADVVPHRPVGGDRRAHVLETVDPVDDDAATLVPLPLGGVVAHHGRVLHRALPNVGDQDRYAYVIAFEAPPLRRGEPRPHGWLEQRETDAMARTRAWRRRGGALVDARRRAARVLRDPGRLVARLPRRGT